VGANGKWAVEFGRTGRWVIRAQNAVYGYSASMGLVDEAWAIDPEPISEGIEPTMAEREQPQLWLISTAHSKATRLMPERREQAVARLDSPGDTLIVEWSADPALDSNDPVAWRQASPHWDDRRLAFVGSKVDEAGFDEQWLNRWPSGHAAPAWISAGAWNKLAVPGLELPTGALAARTVAIYPDGKQSRWPVVVAATDRAGVPHLSLAGVGSTRQEAVAIAGEAMAGHSGVLIASRVLRGRIPRVAGVRDVVWATESDVAAATTTLRPLIEGGHLKHDGAEALAEQMTQAVAQTYSDSIRLSSKDSPIGIEAAKAAVLAAWWSTREDRPKTVVV
jgi:phage terminase large subunit-like protein